MSKLIASLTLLLCLTLFGCGVTEIVPETKVETLVIKNAAVLCFNGQFFDTMDQDGVARGISITGGGGVSCTTWASSKRWDIYLVRPNYQTQSWYLDKAVKVQELVTTYQ